ncbi:hypothetical protein BU16DRAFT_615480 [Lophium mytilinum]|uniref:Uncharacterized protein n=1 Tax=Lophium mytilinum TaxID=390894 RepID=A0A6A6R1N4_9PEZI|nr:hypothetical protein BU16DRAFT_615480 [Lophium mytilinum]
MVDVRNGGGEASSFRAVNHPNVADAARSEENAPDIASKATADDVAPSTAADKPSSTRTSTPAAPSDLRQPAPQTQSAVGTPSATDAPAQSQPMTATTSASSHASAKESSAGAAPYGTRSRNRPGTSRINYAEDVEMDFEAAPAPANGTISEAPSRGSLASEGRQSPGSIGKKPNGTGNATWAPTPPSKEAPSTIPGTSSFSANPNVAPAPQPKRRKNAANHATTNGNHSGGYASGQASSRRSTAMIAANHSRETNMMTFEKSKAFLKNGKLEADDGTFLSVNDHVYLVCEPPGEPYYLCRIMEFLHVDNKASAPVDSMRCNWYYRPRDVLRYNNDTRIVYSTMHSDICPITSLRGRCKIVHRSEIKDLDEYRKTKDSFYFIQVFDRFIHRWYEAIPTSSVINVPEKVKKALDERWKYLVVEAARVKELTSAVKTCKRCTSYCASNDSVECAVCRNTYHMTCVRPPLLKKPSRGFAWACGPCSRAQERKLEARRTPLIGGANEDPDEEELLDEEEEDAGGATTTPSPGGSDAPVIDKHPGTQAEIALAKMWPMRYLGIHCRVEDALQYDDRAIYPRASSRLGPRHQANVNVWHGHIVELVKPAEIKKRYVKGPGHKKETKLSKETVAAMEADRAEKAKRPKWVQDEPAGYVRRGEDLPNKDSKCTAELLFKMPPLGVHSSRGEDDPPTCTEEQVKAYMDRAKTFAKTIGVEEYSTNFLDKCLQLFTKHQYDADVALKHVKKIDRRKDLHEPELTKEEMKRWDDGVAKYGSEIRNVRMHVKTISHADAVRYYYLWKKTPKGREIWGGYGGRKGKNKKAEADAKADPSVKADPSTRLLDDVADDYDDSAFDNDKAMAKKRGFQCKFCSTRSSRQWRRAPGAAPGTIISAEGKPMAKEKAGGFVVSLCLRCAGLWRKYAVKWENTDEIAKKVAQGGGKAWKRRIDEELLKEVYAANEAATHPGPELLPEMELISQPVPEPPKKKLKTTAVDKDSGTVTPIAEPVPKKKEKVEKPPPPPRAPTPPPIPAKPRMRILPCAVCRQLEPLGDQHISCSGCKLTVHRNCYGIEYIRNPNWFCDMCKNDKKEQVSYNYSCVLCPVVDVDIDLVEPPKVSHKKKTDREREKERLEKELVDKFREDYRQGQRDKGRPEIPRGPLKRTADNNWVHVPCAVWSPETKFVKAKTLDVVEGVGAPTLRYDGSCKICKTSVGACVSCHQCHALFHVGCAHAANYTFGFDITPVKATRRDAIPTFTIGGETGSMTAAIWCKEHTPKTIVHQMSEVIDEAGTNALQLYAQNYKQADLTLTGTARKASLMDQTTKTLPTAATGPATVNRRTSTTNPTPTSARPGRPSNAGLQVKEEEEDTEAKSAKSERRCATCDIDASPKWWKVKETAAPNPISVSASQPMEGVVMNGVDREPHIASEKQPRPDGVQLPNGTGDHDYAMPDATPPAPDVAVRLTVDTDVAITQTAKYLCQKCHWKKKMAPEEPAELERAPSPTPPAQTIPEPQQLPVRSPPPPPSYPPPMPTWQPNPHMPPQPPHMPDWGSHPPQMSNGIPHPPPPHQSHQPQQVPPMPPHHQPYQTPYTPMHQTNGYQQYSGPPSYQSMHHGPIRSPYPPLHTPAPLHLSNAPMMTMTNGMHSPHLPYSPTHPNGPPHANGPPPHTNGPPPHHNGSMPSRQTESPFAYPNHHGSPGPGQLHNTRPSTPRDVAMRETPTAPPQGDNRMPGGASASPSLRNLLH